MIKITVDRMVDMKMYIAVLDSVPAHMVPVLVAHTVLSAHVKFSAIVSYNDWFLHSFKKCVLSVNKKEFSKIAELPNVCIGHENKTLNGEPSCIVVCPRGEYPNVLKFAKLWIARTYTDAELTEIYKKANGEFEGKAYPTPI